MAARRRPHGTLLARIGCTRRRRLHRHSAGGGPGRWRQRQSRIGHRPIASRGGRNHSCTKTLLTRVKSSVYVEAQAMGDGTVLLPRPIGRDLQHPPALPGVPVGVGGWRSRWGDIPQLHFVCRNAQGRRLVALKYEKSIAVFPILTDVVEVKTGSGPTAHWSIHFTSGVFKRSFPQAYPRVFDSGMADPYFMDPLLLPATHAGKRAVSKRVASAANGMSAFVDR